VYLAEQLAKHLRGSNGVDVMVRHIELEKMDLEETGPGEMELEKKSE
jgi:hypothetical protein